MKKKNKNLHNSLILIGKILNYNKINNKDSNNKLFIKNMLFVIFLYTKLESNFNLRFSII